MENSLRDAPRDDGVRGARGGGHKSSKYGKFTGKIEGINHAGSIWIVFFSILFPLASRHPLEFRNESVNTQEILSERWQSCLFHRLSCKKNEQTGSTKINDITNRMKIQEEK